MAGFNSSGRPLFSSKMILFYSSQNLVGILFDSVKSRFRFTAEFRNNHSLHEFRNKSAKHGWFRFETAFKVSLPYNLLLKSPVSKSFATFTSFCPDLKTNLAFQDFRYGFIVENVNHGRF